MLKKIVLKGAHSGAKCGFSSAILYAFIIGVSKSEASLASVLSLLLLIPYIAFLPVVLAAFLGAVTGSVFGLLFFRYHAYKVLYIVVCVSLCSLVAMLINSLAWNWLSLDNFNMTQSYYALFKFAFITIFMVPSMIYIFFSFIVGIYMFNTFEIIKLEHEISEEDALSASA